MTADLQSAVQRALSAWDTTTLKTNGDGMLSEAMESLRAEFGSAVSGQPEWRCPETGRTCTADDCGRECEQRPAAENYDDPAPAEGDRVRTDLMAAHARISAEREGADKLRRALEIIAVGDSKDPVTAAGDELVALGYWDADALAAARAGQPQPNGTARDADSDESRQAFSDACDADKNMTRWQVWRHAVTWALKQGTQAPAPAPGEPVARLLHWHGPSHYRVPHGGIAARTFAEFSREAADAPDSYWKNGAPLYTGPAQAPAVGADAALVDALQDALSVCRSVDRSKSRTVEHSGCTMHLQTAEWCAWLEKEVAPKLEQALAAITQHRKGDAK